MPAQPSLVSPAAPPPELPGVPRRLARESPRLRRYRVSFLAVLVVIPLYGVWAAFLATGGGDLAAQFAWQGFAARHPGTPYAMFWYGGTHTVNYSVISPPLMALLGVRTVSVVSGVVATWLLASLLERTLPRALWPALLGALGLWANIASGRTTFALGVAFGLASLLVLASRSARPARLIAGSLGGLLATLASPVAGLFLLVAGAGYLLDRQYAKGLVLALPPAVVVTCTTLLFPFQGEQPMAAHRMLMPLILSLAVAFAAPRDWRVVRTGAATYVVGVVLTYLIPSPIGTNVERLPALFAPAVLLAALLNAGSGGVRLIPVRTIRTRSIRTRAILPTAMLALALTVSAQWTIASTVADLRVITAVPAWAKHTDQVIAELDRLGAGRSRVEVVPARNHREATLFAPHVQLMRGWNRQLDVERGRLFYDGDLDEPRYHAWLRHWAVGYVVLPHARPDGPAEREAALVRAGQSWLQPVWQDAHWKIYRVTDATPLASAPAEVLNAGEADVVLDIPRAGTVTIRVAYSPWLRADGACVRASGPWTRLTVPRAGVYRLTSSYAAGHSHGHGCR
ncbi:hypothetical protein ACFWMJ_34640 [Streptomyces hawaiiensis]|uniref:hypothetical protein n=1 Tax=Streptomyces hawaiiensis TaxID=67305 RepID=UPI00365C385D